MEYQFLLFLQAIVLLEHLQKHLSSIGYRVDDQKLGYQHFPSSIHCMHLPPEYSQSQQFSIEPVPMQLNLLHFEILSASTRSPILVHISIIHHRSEEHTSELQSRPHLVCRLLLEKKNNH